MDHVNRHIIQKQVWELTTRGFNDSDELQKEVSTRNAELLEVIDEVFTELSATDQITRFDRIEIDLGSFQKDSFLQLLKSELKKRLRGEVLDRSSGTSSPDFTVDSSVGIDNKESVKILSDAARTRSLLMFFLQKGYLPWWCHDQETPDIETLLEDFLTKGPKQELVAFFKNLMEQETSSKRLIANLTVAGKKKILDKLTPSPQIALALIETLFQLIWKERVETPTRSFYEKNPLIGELWILVLRSALKTDSLAEMIISALKLSYRDLSNAYFTEVRKESFNAFLRAFRNKVNSGAYDLGSVASQFRPTKITSNTYEQILRVIDKKIEGMSKEAIMPFADDPVKSHDLSSGDDPQRDQTEAESISCTNAGLILLWPYLNGFFKKLGWVKGKQFVSEEDQVEAVYLLHYLATGHQKGYEYDLTLNKLLCGLPLEFPIEKHEKFSKETLLMADELLVNVVKNWTVLKSTSIDGLRHSFLKRSGLLNKQMKGYLLKIERTGIDVLLDRLPYGLNMIILPWRKNMITCEW